METRTITQIKVYGLVLNTMERVESGALVALAVNEQSLKDFYKSQLLKKPKIIGNWVYNFKEGPLRHYNPSGIQSVYDSMFGHGIFSEWVEEQNIKKNVYRVDF
jgi:hypothetical protein